MKHFFNDGAHDPLRTHILRESLFVAETGGNRFVQYEFDDGNPDCLYAIWHWKDVTNAQPEESWQTTSGSLEGNYPPPPSYDPDDWEEILAYTASVIDLYLESQGLELPYV